MATKLLRHPCAYVALALVIGFWAVPIAWLHQGAGLAGHVWFSRKHGFTWYSVEDPARYRQLSRNMLDTVRRERSRVD